MLDKIGKNNIDSKDKVLGCPCWFTLHDGECIGIVLMNNGFEDKAYIGRGQGITEKEDVLHILRWGIPFPIECARFLYGIRQESYNKNHNHKKNRREQE